MPSSISVCHIISGDVWAGAEASAFNLIKQLSSEGYAEISVVTFSSGILTDKLQHNKIATVTYDESEYSSFMLFFKLARYIKATKPNIIHVHNIKEHLFGGIAARLFGVKAIFRTYHGKGFLDRSLIKKIIERFNDRFLSTQSISVSMELQQYINQVGIRKSEQFVLYNGIDTETISYKRDSLKVRQEFGIDDKTVLIGIIGRLVPVKGHQYFIACAKKLIQKNKNLVFLIVGEGPLEMELREQIGCGQYRDQILMTGFRPDVIEIIAALDVFVIASYHEGLPMVLLEAMLLEKPVVATRVGGIPEVIKDGCTGLLVPPCDSSALEVAISGMLNDRSLMTSLGVSGRKKLKEELDIRKNTKKLLGYYRKSIRQ